MYCVVFDRGNSSFRLWAVVMYAERSGNMLPFDVVERSGDIQPSIYKVPPSFVSEGETFRSCTRLPKLFRFVQERRAYELSAWEYLIKPQGPVMCWLKWTYFGWCRKVRCTSCLLVFLMTRLSGFLSCLKGRRLPWRPWLTVGCLSVGACLLGGS